MLIAVQRPYTPRIQYTPRSRDYSGIYGIPPPELQISDSVVAARVGWTCSLLFTVANLSAISRQVPDLTGGLSKHHHARTSRQTKVNIICTHM